MPHKPYQLPGLEVYLDKLLYQPDSQLSGDYPHAFIYFLTLHNGSNREVTFLGRKWLIERSGGDKWVIEGDGIVGKTPHLQPGESFSYNSFHITDQDSVATGSFHGVDASNNAVFVRIPALTMKVPELQ